MRLPKPLYEILPYFLVAIGGLFIYLVLRQYEYAPTLFIWLLGMFCVLGGVSLIVTRWIYRHSIKAYTDSNVVENDGN